MKKIIKNLRKKFVFSYSFMKCKFHGFNNVDALIMADKISKMYIMWKYPQDKN